VKRRATYQAQHQAAAELPGQVAFILWMMNAAIALALGFVLITLFIQPNTGVTL